MFFHLLLINLGLIDDTVLQIDRRMISVSFTFTRNIEEDGDVYIQASMRENLSFSCMGSGQVSFEMPCKVSHPNIFRIYQNNEVLKYLCSLFVEILSSSNHNYLDEFVVADASYTNKMNNMLY